MGKEDSYFQVRRTSGGKIHTCKSAEREDHESASDSWVRGVSDDILYHTLCGKIFTRASNYEFVGRDTTGSKCVMCLHALNRQTKSQPVEVCARSQPEEVYVTISADGEGLVFFNSKEMLKHLQDVYNDEDLLDELAVGRDYHIFRSVRVKMKPVLKVQTDIAGLEEVKYP